MRKWITYLILMLVMIQVVNALKDCEGVMNPSDLPCIIYGSWTPSNPCNTYEAKIFNETPTLIDTRTLGTYGVINRCNITFGISSNQTKIGSYHVNFTYGDTMRVNLEAEEMNYITIGLMLGIVTFVFAFLATKVKHWALQIGLSLFTMVMVVFDFFISARIIEIVDSAQTGMIYYLDTFFKIGVTLFRFALAGTVIYLIYYMYKHIIVNPIKKREQREEEGMYG